MRENARESKEPAECPLGGQQAAEQFSWDGAWRSPGRNRPPNIARTAEKRELNTILTSHVFVVLLALQSYEFSLLLFLVSRFHLPLSLTQRLSALPTLPNCGLGVCMSETEHTCAAGVITQEVFLASRQGCVRTPRLRAR